MAIVSAPRRGHLAHRSHLALGAALVLAAFGVALAGCGSGVSSSVVQGSGIAATQTRAMPRFSSLELAGDNNDGVMRPSA
jgi:hypothetical protein